MKWTVRRFTGFQVLLRFRLCNMASTSRAAPEGVKNDLSVPEAVCGMKKLDKAKFSKIIRVQCYFFEQSKATKVLRILNPYLIKMLSLQPVQEGHEPCCRVAYLDPVKVPNGFQDLDDRSREALINLGSPAETTPRKLKIGYKNFRADEILRAIIPKELDTVSGYTIVGHIAHLNLRPELEKYKAVIGQVIIDKVAHVLTVINKTDSIDSTYRNFKMEVIAGEASFETTLRENKCLYSFDFSKVYWNSRLSNEHQKVVSMLAKGDVLFDVFCGVGPFVIPAAKKGVRCFANDLNPAAVFWLDANVRANKVKQANITIWSLDGAKFIQDVLKRSLLELRPGDYKILVTMNLPSMAPSFFANFKGLLTPDEYAKIEKIPKPKVRVYCFVKCPEAEQSKEAIKLITSAIDMDLDEEIDRVEHVRNVAPNKEMMMVQVILTRRILVDAKRPASDEVEEIDPKKGRKV